MKVVQLVMAAWLAVAGASAQSAAVINQGDIGKVFGIDYVGTIGGSVAPSVSALENFTFTGLSNNGYTYNFAYALTNDSTANSRLRSFGFDVTSPGLLSGLASTGVYNSAILTPLVSGLLGTREVCFAATSFLGTCASGSDAASSSPGQTGTGTFALTFATMMSSVTLDNFAVQFQSINPTVNGATLGLGLGTAVSAAPEPTTWVMLFVGFGLIGATLRHRDRRRSAMLAAC